MKIRQHQIGDLGWIISKHGEIYHSEFNFDESFETNIAGKVGEYFAPDSAHNRIWIVEVDEQRAGSVAIRELSEQTAFVNFVLVLNQYRGKGIARRLMETAITWTREQRYSILQLETYTVLEDARELYKLLGFEIIESNVQLRFGQRLTQEYWQLVL